MSFFELLVFVVRLCTSRHCQLIPSQAARCWRWITYVCAGDFIQFIYGEGIWVWQELGRCRARLLWASQCGRTEHQSSRVEAARTAGERAGGACLIPTCPWVYQHILAYGNFNMVRLGGYKGGWVCASSVQSMVPEEVAPRPVSHMRIIKGRQTHSK